jgi:hypothetical protein
MKSVVAALHRLHVGGSTTDKLQPLSTDFMSAILRRGIYLPIGTSLDEIYAQTAKGGKIIYGGDLEASRALDPKKQRHRGGLP